MPSKDSDTNDQDVKVTLLGAPSSKSSLRGGLDGLVGTISAILHCSLLLVLTVLVAVLCNSSGPTNRNLTLVECWSLTPVPCSDGGARTCAVASWPPPASNGSAGARANCTTAQTCDLVGVSTEYERKATGLFASVHAPFLALALQVVGAAFAMIYVHYAGRAQSNAQKGLKRVAMTVLIVYGTFFLFIQRTWGMPMNNLLLVEVTLMLALFYIGLQRSWAYAAAEMELSAPARFVDACLAMPLLAAAALTASGVDAEDELLQSYACLLFSYMLLLGAEYQRAALLASGSGDEDPDGRDALRVLLLSSWLALAPFVAECSVVLNAAEAPSTWATATLVLLLAFVLLFHTFVTVHAERRELLQAILLPDDPAESFEYYVAALDAHMLVARGVVALTLVIGAMSTTNA